VRQRREPETTALFAVVQAAWNTPALSQACAAGDAALDALDDLLPTT